MKLRPYISIDLETTGLDVEKVQILQIGWVIDDGVSPINSLEKGSILIQRFPTGKTMHWE
jgi:oligoribonuclease (3'-5' exoribonuclease)